MDAPPAVVAGAGLALAQDLPRTARNIALNCPNGTNQTSQSSDECQELLITDCRPLTTGH